MSQAGINHTSVLSPRTPLSLNMLNEPFTVMVDEVIISAWGDYCTIFTAIDGTEGEMADAMTRHLCHLSHRIEDATATTALGVLIKARIAFISQREDAETQQAIVAGTFTRAGIAADEREDLPLWSMIESLEAIVAANAGIGRA